MEPNYLLHGNLMAKTGEASALAAILIEASKLLAADKTCHLYVVSQDDTDTDRVWITEIWESKEAHDKSLSIPGVRELISKAMPLLDGPPVRGQELRILDGYHG